MLTTKLLLSVLIRYDASRLSVQRAPFEQRDTPSGQKILGHFGSRFARAAVACKDKRAPSTPQLAEGDTRRDQPSFVNKQVVTGVFRHRIVDQLNLQIQIAYGVSKVASGNLVGRKGLRLATMKCGASSQEPQPLFFSGNRMSHECRDRYGLARQDNRLQEGGQVRQGLVNRIRRPLRRFSSRPCVAAGRAGRAAARPALERPELQGGNWPRCLG